MSTEDISKIGRILNNPESSLNARFRALFTLKNLGGQQAVDEIVKGFQDPSALLKHELAYCLGQMGNSHAIPHLISVLKDVSQEPMVRHEAGEALGAIEAEGLRNDVLTALKEHLDDSQSEVAETCRLAIDRVMWCKENPKNNSTECAYTSVDPAPPEDKIKDVQELDKQLSDENAPLFSRYKAMFALRNIGTQEAVDSLGKALVDDKSSALFRHEIAFVLGQMRKEGSISFLEKSLADLKENEMVRHECAEALGSIATEECNQILQKYLGDGKRVVRESCEIALDISEYENSEDFQYADCLAKVHET